MLIPAPGVPGAGVLISKARSRLPVLHRGIRVLAAIALSGWAGRLIVKDRVYLDFSASAEADPGRGIYADLKDLFGRPIWVGIAAGTSRINRKPVLSVVDRLGRTVGYCKIATTPLTQRLVATEAAALRDLEGCSIPGVEVPLLLRLQENASFSYLVVAPLRPPILGGWVSADRAVEGMSALASVRGLQTAEVAATSWWSSLTSRLAGLPGSRNRDLLRRVGARLNRRYGTGLLTEGRCHGDWTRWNTAQLRQRVLLWDFERSMPWAPLGFDSVHFSSREVLDDSGGVTLYDIVRLAPLAIRAASLLPIQPAEPARVYTFYLYEMAVRALCDSTTVGSPNSAAVALQWAESVDEWVDQ